MENYSFVEQTAHNKPSITSHYKANVATTLLSALSIKVEEGKDGEYSLRMASASYVKESAFAVAGRFNTNVVCIGHRNKRTMGPSSNYSYLTENHFYGNTT